MSETKVKKTRNSQGDEIISILDETGNDAMTITMESIFDNREIEELDATNILSKAEVKALKKPKKKTSRLEVYKGSVLDKKTGEMMLITWGNVPKNPADYPCLVFINCREPSGTELYLSFPLNKDGKVPDAYPYDLIPESNL